MKESTVEFILSDLVIDAFVGDDLEVDTALQIVLFENQHSDIFISLLLPMIMFHPSFKLYTELLII